MSNEENQASPPEVSQPPFGKKWEYWYLAVLLWLFCQVVLYILFTRAPNM